MPQSDTMTPREIVEATLAFSGPDRVACGMAPPWPSDFIGAGPKIDRGTDWQKVDDQLWERTDEWGNLWRRIDPSSKGEVAVGVLKSMDEVEELDLPDVPPDAFDHARQVYADDNGQHFPIGGIPGFTFNICRKLRRIDQYFMDLVSEPEKMRRLHDRIDDLLARWIEGLGRAGARAIMFAEDWGTQNAPFISPDLFHEEFYPRYQRLCGVARDHGMYVFLHSCGKVTPLMPDMIAAGVNLFQYDQPRLHGLDALEQFQEQGKVTYWCPVDIQVTLPTRDPDRIRQNARELLDRLWRAQGGFVAGYYNDNASLGLDPEVQRHACEEFLAYGRRDQFAAV